ncbi:MAG TPA: hypothetical protein VMV26_12620 [Alphaproteobacteria bacterium]|nr:hypothetical protein [Alphaproteobacteria bacterium]
MTHAFVTVAVPVERGRSDAVERRLDELGNPPSPALKEALDAAAFVHFMSMTVVRGDGDDPSHLVIEVNADGTEREAIRRLEAALGEKLRGLLEVAGVDPGASLVQFLERHHKPVGEGWFSTPGLNFDGTPGMTVTQIRQEATLAQRIGDMLDALPPFPSALAALDYVRDALWAENAMKWAFIAAPAPCLEPAPPVAPGVIAAAGSAVVVFLWPFVLLALAVFGLGWWAFGFATGVWLAVIAAALELGALLLGYAALRRLEESDVPEDITPSAELVASVMKHENFYVHNNLASTSTMKPGRLRRLTLRIGFFLARMGAQHFSRPSFLTKNSVIHFARWILLPGTDKLLFRSNYDGAWGSYVEDFVELSSDGVNGIWSNTKGFPKTENLIKKGSQDSNRLMRWARRQQHPTHCWYSAYPQLTLARIRTNAAIRQGLALARTEAEAADWLASFGSAPRPAGALETREIPTIVYGGLSPLAHASCLRVYLSDNAAAGRRWIESLEARLSFGETRGATEALVLALSAPGLKKLGLDAAGLASFPAAFVQGMAAEARRRVLGDIGPSAPDKWLWGGPGAEVDAVLLVYADSEARLADRVAALHREAAERGHELHPMPMAPLDPASRRAKEPFGFADGISQPIVRGTRRRIGEREEQHAVAPGEVVLGYPDNLGYLAASPTVPAAADPANLLPAAGGDPLRQRPNFAHPQPTGAHDIGVNGSFLVIRQLEQDVDAFNGFARQAAGDLAGDPRAPHLHVPATEWVKAKMVGRWKDGSSLVRYPQGPANPLDADTGAPRAVAAPPPAPETASAGARRGTAPDNDFLYGAEDPQGLRCPLGAHIRRANPRESFQPGSPERLAITNRHRILRIGRPYQPQKGQKPGLLFMCLNADIERQFEFVQQTWLMGATFHGLEHEKDPTQGHDEPSDASGAPARPRCFTIPTPDGPLRLKGLKDFVTVKGGGYFFLPSRRAVRYIAAGGAAALAEGDEGAYPRRAETPSGGGEEQQAAE